MPTPHGFDLIFKPRSIAVVGASNEPATVGKAVMDNLLWGEFDGAIYPVNIKPVTFPNLTSYPSLKAIDQPIDLVVVIVPAAVVPKVMQQAAEVGAKAAIIISAGFSEAGPAGAKLEQEVVTIAHEHGMMLIGPNCLGVLNPHHKLNASFAGAIAKPGSVAFVSQSGALCTAVLDLADQFGIGFSKFASIGNKALLHEIDLFQYLMDDPETKVILAYIEDLEPHSTWVDSMRRITHHPVHPKPVIMIKAGRTASGSVASQSHTGSLAGDDAAYDAFFTQSGVVRADTLEELFWLANVFTTNQPPRHPGVAIITNAGGPGILATDAAELHHLAMAEITPSTQKNLRKVLPPSANLHNPIDMIGDADADRYKNTLQAVGQDSHVGSLLVILTPQAMTDPIALADSIIALRKKHPGLALVASFIGGEAVRSGVAMLHRAGIATVAFPDAAALCLAKLTAYGQFVHAPLSHASSASGNKQTAEKVISGALASKQLYLGEAESEEILKAYRLPLVKSGVAKTSVEAVQIAHELGGAVALKVLSPQVMHKTDVGGVRLNVAEAEVAKAYEEMVKSVRHKVPSAKITGVLVQQMQGLGREVIIGAKRDPVFGPVMMFGLGGIYVEVLRDVVFALAPLGQTEAEAMLTRIRSADLLNGSRGTPALDHKAVVDCLIKVSTIMVNHPAIQELDINPLVVGEAGQGAKVLDARIIVKAVDKLK